MNVDEQHLLSRQTKTAHVRPTAYRWFLGAIGALTGLTFILIMLTVNKGFDWSDEGFVYTLLTNNRVSDGEVWGFQHLLHPLFAGVGESIVAFRVFRLLGYVGLSILLCWIAKLILGYLGISLRRSSWLVVILVAQVGTFAAWSYPPRYLGYNELASWLTQASGALLMFLLVASRSMTQPRTRFPRVGVWGIVGALISMVYLAKFTAAFFLLVLAAIVLIFIPTFRERVRSAIAFAIGIVATIAILLSVQIPLLEYSRSVIALMGDSSTQSASGYSFSALLATYLQSASITISAISIPAILIAIGLITAKGRGGRFSSPSPLVTSLEHVAFAFILLLGLIMVLPRSESNWDAIGITNALLFSIAVIGFAILATAAPNPSDSNIGVTIALGLFLFTFTPLGSAIGTNNTIFGQTLFSASFWAVGAAIMLCLFAERVQAFSFLARSIPMLVLSLISLTGALAVVGDVFVHPYRTSPYFDQTTRVDVGALRGISLLPKEAAVATWLHDAGSRHAATAIPTVSMATPGVLLAFNASAWTNAWPGLGWSESITRSCTLEYPDELFVLQSGSAMPDTSSYKMVVDGLARCDISFPQDFVKVDERVDSEPEHNISIWKLSDEPSSR